MSAAQRKEFKLQASNSNLCARCDYYLSFGWNSHIRIWPIQPAYCLIIVICHNPEIRMVRQLIHAIGQYIPPEMIFRFSRISRRSRSPFRRSSSNRSSSRCRQTRDAWKPVHLHVDYSTQSARSISSAAYTSALVPEITPRNFMHY